MLGGKTKPANGDGRVRYDYRLAYETDAVTTDADGRWHIDGVPNNAQATLALKVSHPDYVSDEYWQGNQPDAGVTTAMLRNGTATATLKRGIIVRGRVTDPAGKPIKDALIGWSSGNAPIDADGQGRFRLPPVPPGARLLTVIAPGWAPLSGSVNIQAGLPPQDFRMTPGKSIQLRFVDATGKPIPDVWVRIYGWGGKPHYINHPKIPEFTDKNGIWEWTARPTIL